MKLCHVIQGRAALLVARPRGPARTLDRRFVTQDATGDGPEVNVTDPAELTSELASNRTRHARRALLTTGLGLAIAIAVGAPAAGAATALFPSIGLDQQFTVPAGVRSILVTAIGASGGNTTGATTLGGRGATITDTLDVSPGQVLYVEVGRPGNSGEFCCSSAFNGGGPGGSLGAGGGGGASDVRTIPAAFATTLTSRLIVAAGGGGGGHMGSSGAEAGADATSACCGAGGGGGATATAGGTGGTALSLGMVGRLGFGGAGGLQGQLGGGGGGGGGGRYGGGGGGGDPAGGGGGGGGSSFSPSSVIASPTAADASVTINWVPVPAVTASTSSVGFSAQAPGTASSGQDVTVTNSGSAPLQIGSVGLTGADPGDFVVGSAACSTAIAVNGSCTISVRFAPTAPGARTATLQIPSNALTSPTTVALAGNAANGPAASGGSPATGGPGSGPTVASGEFGPPILGALRLQPSRFKVAATNHSATGRSTVTYTDSQAATTTFTVSRKARGVRRGRSCLPLPKPSRPGQRRCTRLIVIGSFSHADTRGVNSVVLTGHVPSRGRQRVLAPALYVLRAAPRLGALSGPVASATFRVLR